MANLWLMIYLSVYIQELQFPQQAHIAQGHLDQVHNS